MMKKIIPLLSIILLAGVAAEDAEEAFQVSVVYENGVFTVSNISEVEAYYIPEYLIDTTIYEMKKEVEEADMYYHLQIVDSNGKILSSIPREWSLDVDAEINETLLFPRFDRAERFVVIDEGGNTVFETSIEAYVSEPEDQIEPEVSESRDEEGMPFGVTELLILALVLVVIIMVLQSYHNKKINS